MLPNCGNLLIVPSKMGQSTSRKGVAIKAITPASEVSGRPGLSMGRSLMRRPSFGTWFPLSVFALTRFIDFVMISLSARTQIALTHTLPGYIVPPWYTVYSPTPASPDYLTAITNWDGQWYQRIVEQGYAGTAVGDYEQYAKAFVLNQPPLFPFLVRIVVWATGLGFGAAATVVNLLAGSVTVLLLYRLVEPHAGRFVAGSAVALLSTFMSAPVLQLAYKDGLALMLILLAMLLITRRRYWLAVVAILALSMTRQVTPPLAIVLAAHAWTRFRNRRDSPIGRCDGAAMAAVFITSITALFAWSTIVRLWLGGTNADGSRGSVASIGRAGFGWFGQADTLFGLTGVVVITAFLLILIGIAYSPAARTWGPETRAWLWAYPAFLMVGTTMHTGQLRYFLADFPLMLIIAGSPPVHALPKIRVVMVTIACLVGLGLQWLWIDHALIIHSESISDGTIHLFFP